MKMLRRSRDRRSLFLLNFRGKKSNWGKLRGKDILQKLRIQLFTAKQDDIKEKARENAMFSLAFSWRGREDLNLRDAFYTSYSLSRGAPSASWVLPQVDGKFSWRREWDSNPRMLSHRRFSRPVPSTARPSLRVVSPRLSLKRGLYHTIPRRCLSTVPREFFAFSRISAQRRRVWRMMR